MNTKGQAVFYTFMLAIVIIILAMALAVPVKQHIDVVRGNNTATQQGLDCANSSITDYQKGQCVLTDLTIPYFFFGLLAISGIVVGAKLVFGN